MTYQPPDGASVPVETMTFAQLRARNDGSTQRADFHVIGLVDSGHGAATADFTRLPLEPGSAVWIPPGAVHRWDDVAEVCGTLVLFTPTAPMTETTREIVAALDIAGAWRLPEATRPFVDMARTHLTLETEGAGTDRLAELPAILLSAFIARLHPPHGEAPSVNPVFRAFRARVEMHFREHHDAVFYAHTLGYAPRTLARAAQQATGRTAKGYIVDRIILEAKRLLVHDRLTAASCATALGFVDASNFSIFFRHATGMRPGAWQNSALRAAL